MLADDNDGVVRAARSLTIGDNGRELHITVSRQNRQTLIMTVTLAVLPVFPPIPFAIYAADGYQGPIGDFQTPEGATVSYEGGLEGTPFTAISPPPDSTGRVALSLTAPVYGPAVLTATAALFVKKSGLFPSMVRATLFLNVLGPQSAASVTISPYSSHAGVSLPTLFAAMTFALIGESGDLTVDEFGVLKAARDLEFPLSYGATVEAVSPEEFLGNMLFTVSVLADCLSATGFQNNDPLGSNLYDYINSRSGANNHSNICGAIRQGANVNWTSSDFSRTPLHAAAEDGLLQIAGMLIRAGANLQVQTDPHLATPLYRAVGGQRSAMVSLLLDAGADPNLPNSRGRTPLDSAIIQAENNSGRGGDIIETVREAGGVCLTRQDADECGGFYFYPLQRMVTVRTGHVSVAYEATLNVPDGAAMSYHVVSGGEGFTLSAPAGGGVGFGLSTDQRQTIAGAQRVVSVRIVSTKTGDGGWTLTLTTAVSVSVSDSALLCAPNTMPGDGRTPIKLARTIMEATDNGEPDSVCELIRRGAHFKTRHTPSEWWSPLHATTERRVTHPRSAEKLEIAEMLLYNGADPNATRLRDYITPRRQASYFGDTEMMNLIASYGGNL